MVQPVKIYTVGITEADFKKLSAICKAQQRTPAEILTIAINLLSVALPHAKKSLLKPFIPAPRNRPGEPRA